MRAVMGNRDQVIPTQEQVDGFGGKGLELASWHYMQESLRKLILATLITMSLLSSCNYIGQIKSSFVKEEQPVQPGTRNDKRRLNTVTGQHVEAAGAINVLSSAGF
jgi:hypothetical protein